MRNVVAIFAFMATGSAFAASAELEPAAVLVHSFVRALTADDWKAFVPIIESFDEVDRLHTVAQVLDKYECINVRSYRISSEESGIVHLQIDASALTAGKPRRPVSLPSAWVLEIVPGPDGWRIRRAESEERRAVRFLLRAQPKDGDWGAAFASCPGLDPVAFAWELADQVAEYPFSLDATRPLAFSAELARAAGDKATESYCLSMASWTASENHQNDALDWARASIDAAEAAHDADAMAAARFRLGFTQWLISRATADDTLAGEACRSLDSAASLIESLDDPRMGIKSLYMSGYINRMRGNIRDFLLRNEKVIELARLYDWAHGAASAELAIGEFHALTGNYASAIRDFRSAHEDAERANALNHAGDALLELGVAQMKSGDLAGAAESLRRADRLTGPSVEREAQVGAILMKNGQFDEAEDCLVNSRYRARSFFAWGVASAASTSLSQLRLLQHRPGEALAFANEALNDQALVVSTVEWSRWNALLAKAKALRALGERRRAAAVLRDAVDAVEEQRQEAPSDAVASARFFEDKTESYLELIDLLVDLGRTPEAFEYAERMKGGALRDALARGNLDRHSMLTTEEREEERSLNQRLTDLNKEALTLSSDETRLSKIRRQIEDSREALERFAIRVEIAHPALRMPRADSKRESRRAPAALGGGIAIEFVVHDHRTIVFVASRRADGTAHIISRSVPVTRGELWKRVTRLERQIAERNLEWTRSALALYQLLLGPVDDAVKSHRLICIVPDGVLWRVPFHLLRRPSGELLVERAAIFYAPSLNMIHAAARHGKPSARSGGGLVAFGNPTVVREMGDRVRAMARDASLGDLPDAESEVRAIASLFGAGRSRVYLRDAARESVFKAEASRFGILHLAAHGVLDDHSPMYSAILLATASGDGDDGLLEAREILNLRIGADLAVLASCDTAKGHIGAGEGVIGMSWAFLVAGCPTTVVSQWRADSKATETLMIAFYRRLHAGDAPARALQRAQLSVRADPRYADPLYWAPFIVVGAGMRAPIH